MLVWYDGAWVYPKHWPGKQKKKDRTVVARDETSATVKKVNRLEQATTIRMPKLIPRTPSQLNLIDCSLSHFCYCSGELGLENDEAILNAHLVDRHGSNWESMLKRIKAAGWKNDERTLKAYDCPMSSSCSRKGKAGFGSAEEVMEHLKAHGQDNPKEGDLLVPVLRMG